MQLIFHSQVALSPSRSQVVWIPPVSPCNILHSSRLPLPPHCPAAHYWDILLGLLASGLIFPTQSKTSSAVLIISLFQLYSCMGSKNVQKERWFSTILLSLTGKHSAVRSFPAHLLLCYPMSGRLDPAQLALAQIPPLLLMTWEHESQSFSSSRKFPVQSKICRLKVNLFYSASWPALK